jgi:hypothetical protein
LTVGLSIAAVGAYILAWFWKIKIFIYYKW